MCLTRPRSATVSGLSGDGERLTVERFTNGDVAFRIDPPAGALDAGAMVYLSTSALSQIRDVLGLSDAPYPAVPDPRAAYLSPCPPGYGTVLGHLTQQGKEPEDVGLRDGQRLARIAKDLGVPTMWVGSGEALRDVCQRVRAYPEAFLTAHLGPVVERFVVPMAQRPAI